MIASNGYALKELAGAELPRLVPSLLGLDPILHGVWPTALGLADGERFLVAFYLFHQRTHGTVDGHLPIQRRLRPFIVFSKQIARVNPLAAIWHQLENPQLLAGVTVETVTF